MKQVRQENSERIGRIYTAVRAEIFSIFRQACIAEDTCKDLVQDVFIKIMGLDIIIEDHLRGLAVKIAYQKRTDYLRHRAYINKVKGDMSGWQIEQSYTNMDAEVADLQRIEMKVVSRMSELDRRTYVLSRFEEKTADEIALDLDLTKRAVESRLLRTRIKVRKTVRQAMNF